MHTWIWRDAFIYTCQKCSNNHSCVQAAKPVYGHQAASRWHGAQFPSRWGGYSAWSKCWHCWPDCTTKAHPEICYITSLFYLQSTCRKKWQDTSICDINELINLLVLNDKHRHMFKTWTFNKYVFFICDNYQLNNLLN